MTQEIINKCNKGLRNERNIITSIVRWDDISENVILSIILGIQLSHLLWLYDVTCHLIMSQRLIFTSLIFENCEFLCACSNLNLLLDVKFNYIYFLLLVISTNLACTYARCM